MIAGDQAYIRLASGYRPSGLIKNGVRGRDDQFTKTAGTQVSREVRGLAERGFCPSRLPEIGPPGMRVMGKKLIRKCETFGCQELGSQNLQIAPGTTVWLCKSCAYRETKALGRINEGYDNEDKTGREEPKSEQS